MTRDIPGREDYALCAVNDTPLRQFSKSVDEADARSVGSVDYWREQAFAMAAGQCCVKSGGLMADDHGNQYCDMQRQRDELRGKLRVMADIMGDALSVIKTIDDGCDPDNESALDSLRAKMAGSIDSARRAEMAAYRANAQSSPVSAPDAI